MHSDGFGRILIQNRGMDECRMGRLVQRLYEMETYRCSPSWPCPSPEGWPPNCDEMDSQLAPPWPRFLSPIPAMWRTPATGTAVVTVNPAGNLAGRNQRPLFRHPGLSRPGCELPENIREDKIEGHMTMAEFMSRRFNPGPRTCESVQNWLEDLQNASNGRRPAAHPGQPDPAGTEQRPVGNHEPPEKDLQFRLQETVEGLSAAAISYYLIGPVSYVPSGLPLERSGTEEEGSYLAGAAGPSNGSRGPAHQGTVDQTPPSN
ncbi:MAG: DUF3422 family protein [Syntrophotaleaceae bacterium]